jgi:hypothetical protein
MPLTLPGCSTSTLVSDIRWILGDYYRDPGKPHVRADRGNHFAAWQEPTLFTTEVRAAFRSLR